LILCVAYFLWVNLRKFCEKEVIGQLHAKPKSALNADSARQRIVIFEITQDDIDCQWIFFVIYSLNKILKSISMIPYKKQLDIDVQISIYENIHIATFNFSDPKNQQPVICI